MTTPKTKPDYTFGELGGVDELAALGIQIDDDAPAAAPTSKRDAAKARQLRDTLTRWRKEQDEELKTVNAQFIERDRALAEEHAPELVAEYDAVLTVNEEIPQRIKDRLSKMAADLPQAKLGKYGKRSVWWAQVDPLTHRWVVPASQGGIEADDLVIGRFNGAMRTAVVDKPESIEDGILLDAGSDTVLGNRAGKVIERFAGPHTELQRRHESGELRKEWEAQEAVSGKGLPEREATPGVADSVGSDAATLTEDAATEYSDATAGMLTNIMDANRGKMRPSTRHSTAEQNRELGELAQANPALAAHMGFTFSATGHPQFSAGLLKSRDAANLIKAFKAEEQQHGGPGSSVDMAQATVRDTETGEEVTITAVQQDGGATVVIAQGKDGELMDAVGAGMKEVAERSDRGDAPSEGAGFEPLPDNYELPAGWRDDDDDDEKPAAEPDPTPSPTDDADTPADVDPGTESSETETEDASESEPPPVAEVMAGTEPDADPPAVAETVKGSGPPEPPQVARVERNDTAEQLQEKWRQADKNIDNYAKAYGITGIPDDAARLVLRADGTIGIERLQVTPQGDVSRTQARPATSGGGGGGSGGGGGGSKPSGPSINLRKSWERMTMDEKQAVIDTINEALARRALLSSALVTMTCSPTGDLSLASGGKMATIIGPCAPRSSPVSPNKALQAHPWLSKRENAVFSSDSKRKSSSSKSKKSSGRRKAAGSRR